MQDFWTNPIIPSPPDYDNKIVIDTCNELGCGTSISVFEPGWMKNVVAMARAGTLLRGSKLNSYFADNGFAGMAPPIPTTHQ